MFWGPDAYEPILEDTGAASGTTGYAADALDRYTSAGPATFGYDGRGNLVSDGTNSYGYDLHDRMTSASTSGGTTLSYDPLGRLWQVSSPAYGKTQFVYDGDHVAVEYDGDSGAVRRRLFWGPGADEPILEDTGGALDCSGTRFLHADERGRVTASADCWGHALQQNSYDEYGIPAPGNRGRFQYTGQAWLPELGLYYYKARMYSPTLGRFLQTDPIGYADGLDWYDYAHGDPVNGSDPSGTSCTGSIILKKCGPGDGVTTIWPNGPSNNNGTGDRGQPQGENTGHAIYVPGQGLPTLVAPNGDTVVRSTKDRYLSSFFLGVTPLSVRFTQQSEQQNVKAKPQPGYDSRVNYCGGSGGPSLPNNVSGASFNEACYAHDNCYNSSGFTKAQCDATFGIDVVVLLGFRGVPRFPNSMLPAMALIAGGSSWLIVHFGGGKYYVPK